MLLCHRKTKLHGYMKMRYPFACIVILTAMAGIFGWDIYIYLFLALILSSIVLSTYEIFCHIAYFREYPLKNYHTSFVRKRMKSCLCYFAAIVISFLLIVLCFTKLITIDTSNDIVVFPAFVFIILIFYAPFFFEDINYVAIYPYFEKRVGDIGTYASGVAIARKINLLDEIAREANLPIISSFGYDDSCYNGMLNWYEADVVLPTIVFLIDTINEKPDIIDDAAIIGQELEKIHDAITKAKESNIKFCFVMNFIGYANATEHEEREGAFF